MAFPATKLGLMVELALGADLTALPSTWSWTDISHYVRFADGITISRGRSDEFATAAPCRAQMTLLDPDGRFVRRNPLGAYYGQLNRNTPLRVLLRPDVNTLSDAFGRTVSNGWGSADVGGAYTVVGSAGDYAVTSGVGRHTHPTVSVRHYSTLPVSLTTFDAYFRVRTGALATGGPLSAGFVFLYVDTGTSLRYELLFNTDASIQVRAVLRTGGTDNFGTSHTVAGLTHVANTFYRVRTQSTSGDGKNFRIKVWADNASEPTAWSAVSNTNAATVSGAVGFTSKRETGNTNSNATVDFEDFTFTDGWWGRFTGYVDEWPTRWADASLKQQLAPITASGLLRRIAQGTTLQSAMYRSYTNTGPIAYWPMEDLANSQQAANAVTGGRPMTGPPNTIKYGSVTGPLGSKPLPDFSQGAILRGTVPASTATQWRVEFSVLVNPLAAGNFVIPIDISSAGGIRTWEIVIPAAATPDTVYLQTVLVDGSFTSPVSSGKAIDDGQWHHLRLDVSKSGGSTLYTLYIDGQPTTTTGTIAQTFGAVSGIVAAPEGLAAENPNSMGQVIVWDNPPIISTYVVFTGNSGETSDTRWARLGTEENLPLVATAVSSCTMGAQLVTKLAQILQDIETTDQGIAFDGVDGQLTFRPRDDRYNQAVSLTLDVSQHQVGWPLEPADDDQQLHNDVTSQRPTGSWWRAIDTTSTNAVGEVGYYSTQVQVNLYNDADLRRDAEWRVALGTSTDVRYPVVPIDLNRNPSLILSWLATDIGDRFQITNVPDTLSPDTVDLVLEGYSEHIDTERWTASANTSPNGPWNVWILQSSTGNQGRLDSNASSLSTNASSGATSLSVATTTGFPLWVTGSVSFDINIAGEQIGVTNISGSSSPQTFTVTRSKNGVVKAQTALDASGNPTKVSLWNPSVLAL